MKITSIKAQIKNENRVSIFLDGKYSFSLTLDQLLEEKIKKNDIIEKARLINLKKLSDEGKLKQRTIEWVLGRPHSTREFKDYLYKKKANKDLIEAWTEEFKEKNYLNDESYAKWFADNRARKNKSTRYISAELYSKGISGEIIKSTLNALDEELSEESVSQDKKSLKNQIIKLKTRPRYQDEQKLKSHLLSKGFRYQDIVDSLNTLDENQS
jgi:regulatory protein